MSNMSYCQFQNALKDLRDCYEDDRNHRRHKCLITGACSIAITSGPGI